MFVDLYLILAVLNTVSLRRGHLLTINKATAVVVLIQCAFTCWLMQATLSMKIVFTVSCGVRALNRFLSAK